MLHGMGLEDHQQQMFNWTQMVPPGQRVFPVMPLQLATERGTGVPRHYGEDAPRYHGGTGTYLPNPVRT